MRRSLGLSSRLAVEFPDGDLNCVVLEGPIRLSDDLLNFGWFGNTGKSISKQFAKLIESCCVFAIDLEAAQPMFAIGTIVLPVVTGSVD